LTRVPFISESGVHRLPVHEERNVTKKAAVSVRTRYY
jgi:hypothetical protein